MTYFKSECLNFFTNKNNIAVYIILLAFSLFYWLSIEKQYESKEISTKNEIQARVDVRDKFLKSIPADEPRELMHPSVVEVLNTWPPIVEAEKARLDALNKKDYVKYAAATVEWYQLEPNFINKKYFIYGNYYADLDATFGRHSNELRLSKISQNNRPVTLNEINDKTSAQSIVRSLNYWLPLIIMLATLFLSMDLLSKDREHKTIYSLLPISNVRRIIIKGFVCFVGVLLSCIPLSIGFIGIGLQNGFGSLDFPEVMLYKNSAAIITIKQFLVYGMMYLLLWIFILIMLSIIINLFIKNNVLALLVLLTIPFGELLYNRVGYGDIHPYISWLPTTYTRVGEVLSGYRGMYLVSKIDLQMTGLKVLSVTACCVFIILILSAYSKPIVRMED
ncbi:hypothetical protein ACWOAH_01210 [Vagococcus vulneris]|uniref:Uncharacterized protein n=1 Tax=Vagococcus vulneris TaxID=1977869 RepID=A0A430A207_9ENTE|nr:hypothetical protein [Vagococcus vulneris]RSU00494.1 hypothetical protein CBF37_00330 [Vagococcus vulneris]